MSVIDRVCPTRTCLYRECRISAARRCPSAAFRQLRFQVLADALVDELQRRHLQQVDLAWPIQTGLDHLVVKVLDAARAHRADAGRDGLARIDDALALRQ